MNTIFFNRCGIVFDDLLKWIISLKKWIKLLIIDDLK